MIDQDSRYMALALALGWRGLGRVAPWPSVGCVIVRSGRIVGRGTSNKAALQHAEIQALEQAGDAAKGATVYVTLEPCSHQGTTPPCADALIKAGVGRVISAMEDPNPQVAGQGIKRLQDAGIAVETGLMAAEASEHHAGFLKVQNVGLPLVTLKLASSFDGRIATASGESRWITGPVARRRVHAMRAMHDAVLVGGGTARKDNPSLTVRGLGVGHRPVRVVWSRRLDVPVDGALAASARDNPVWICHGKDAEKSDIAAWRTTGAELIESGVGKGGQLDPMETLKAMASKGVTRVFCEGGGTLAASLLAADLVDRVAGFTAGVAIGAEGQPNLGAMGIDALSDAPRFALKSVEKIGNDVLHIWHRTD